jgi:uncharacterized protein
VIFKKTKKLEMQTDQFLDKVSEAGLTFLVGVKAYLNDDKEEFEHQIEKMRILENDADFLRKKIEIQLYTDTLIPESRGDVLALLETTDDVVDIIKYTLVEFSVQVPNIPKEFHEQFLKLSDHVIQAVEEMVSAMRSFLRDPLGVRNYLHKVYHHEKEADHLAEKLKRGIFASESLDLSEKIHLRYFALHVDMIADYSENVADRLSIYTIKRSI